MPAFKLSHMRNIRLSSMRVKNHMCGGLRPSASMSCSSVPLAWSVAVKPVDVPGRKDLSLRGRVLICAAPQRPAIVIALAPARLFCDGCQIRKMTIGLELRLSGYLD